MLKDRELERRQNNKDEIDLLVVFSYFERFFQKIGRRITFIAHAVKAHFLLVSIIVAVGVGLGYAAYTATKAYYTSSMTLVLAEIRNEFVEGQLWAISAMIEDNNIEMLASNLDIPTQTARQIKSMAFSNLDEERISQDSILTGSPFRIELSLYDNSLFDTMEPALTNYLENNRYFSKQKRIRQREIESLIYKLKDQIASIDSVKTSVATPSGPVNGFVYGQPIDPTTLYRESLSMYERQVELEAELDQLDNIEVVNGFTPRFRPTGPSLTKFLIIGGVIAFVVGAIAALVLEDRRRSRLSY